MYWDRIDGNLPDRASIKSFGQELHISNIHLSDAGQYECMGLNTESQQRATKAFDVHVECEYCIYHLVHCMTLLGYFNV